MSNYLVAISDRILRVFSHALYALGYALLHPERLNPNCQLIKQLLALTIVLRSQKTRPRLQESVGVFFCARNARLKT